MAESILFGVATEVLKKIGSLLGREVSSLWDLESDLRRLEGTLITIKTLLIDADKKQAQDPQLRDWLRQLQDVFYDAEDVLDEFEIKASRRQVLKQRGSSIRKVRHCFPSSNLLVFGYKIAHKIKEIRERLDQIADDRQKFHLIESHVDLIPVFPKGRETDHYVRPSDVIIGRDDDKEAIISFLMQPTTENVSVIPIVGIGGLGKTTLTKIVYNDEKLKGHFELKMWVCVSDDFDITRLMKEIIHSATGENCKELKVDETDERLREILAGQKFLLVLDDVWNERPMKWIGLRNVLMNGVNGSKIIVSTRSKRVAEIMGTVPPHLIKGLSPEDSLLLFNQWAFKDGKGENFPNLIRIGNDIVGKCRGVPLAVRTLGSLLYANTDEDEWERIKRSDVWQLKQEDEDILPALKLSYDHLPYHLKRCFAYLSLFPKDYDYVSDNTIQCWMAVGLLATSNENEELEDVGLRYTKELSSRCFLEDFLEHDYFFYTFKMHDLMHDLATSMAQIDSSIINFRCPNVIGRFRHFSIMDTDFYGQPVPKPLVNNSKSVRSIIFPREISERINTSFIKTCISKFKCLRLLYLNSIQFEALPNSINTLIHLRYLDLSGNFLLRKLPASICQLQKLQTFRLIGCIRLKKLPQSIRLMICLRYLEITTKQKHLPKNGIECLSSLQSLWLYECHNLVSLFEGRQIGLTGLRTLFIENCSSLISLSFIIRHLPRLETLVICSCENIDLQMELHGDDGNLCFKLRKFIIRHLLSMVHLPRLILQGSANTLQCMKIEICPKLVALPEWLQNLTSLQKLDIESCQSLSSLPEGMQRLTALKELKIRGCPALSESCKRDGSKIAHVKEVHLD